MSVQNPLKYEAAYHEQYESRNGNGYTCGSRHNKGHNTFFRRPYLDVGNELNHYPIDITIGSGLNPDYTPKNPEVFESVVWTIPILNCENHKLKLPLTIQAIQCSAKIHFNVNRVIVGDEIPLLWRTYDDLPLQCSIDYTLSGTKDRRDEYREVLAYHYVDRIQSNSRQEITIPKAESGELFFIFTVKESEFAYIIADIDFPRRFYNKTIFYHRIDNFPLARKFGEDVDFQIRFESLKYSQSNAKKFKIKLNSWDNIELKHPTK